MKTRELPISRFIDPDLFIEIGRPHAYDPAGRSMGDIIAALRFEVQQLRNKHADQVKANLGAQDAIRYGEAMIRERDKTIEELRAALNQARNQIAALTAPTKD
jgi:predicted metal-dependent phosphoesterase TrpH